MKEKIIIGCLIIFSHLTLSKELSDFEEMLSGFPECKFNGVYLGLDRQISQNKYFIDRNMKPYKN